MKLSAVISCVCRLYALWVALRVLQIATAMAIGFERSSFSDSMNIYLGSFVDAVLVGVAWVYAADLGRWAYAEGRSAIETAMKTIGFIFVLSWAGHAVNLFTYWMMMRGLEESSYQWWMTVVGGEAAVIASCVCTLMSIAIVLTARPVGNALRRAERMKELRQLGE